MKPRISQNAMDHAERVPLASTLKDTKEDLRYWLEALNYWRSARSSSYRLECINMSRRNIIIFVMALELAINRPRWYRREVNV